MRSIAFILSLLLVGCSVEVEPEPEIIDEPIDNEEDGNYSGGQSDGAHDSCPPEYLDMPLPDGGTIVMIIPGLCSEMEMYWRGARPDPPPENNYSNSSALEPQGY